MEVPECLDYILAHNLMSNYGSGYTVQSLDNESYKELLYMQACMSAESKATEIQQNKANYYSKAQYGN